MADYIRRIVSGNKARFKDKDLNLELDLVYVTDQVIIMGYPASGMEGFYRNRKEDAIRFLEHRHANNYWIFNFCPIKENSYDASAFGGRVSRYPFPDHHAPPLSIMPLVAREMHAWLKESPERVAVLHCKAGKGRSGTMACTYLLSHGDHATAPQLQRSYTEKEWAKRHIQKAIETLPPDDDSQELAPATSLPTVQESPAPSDAKGITEIDKGGAPPASSSNTERSFTDALKGVLDLHTARRMKAPSEKDSSSGKVKQGVSIPSQRRFLYYWALLLAHDAPKHLWAVNPPADPSTSPTAAFTKSDAPNPKVRLTQLKIRMRETSSMKLSMVKVANKVIERTSMAKGQDASDQVWASLARYDDGLVDLLESWEIYTRDPEGSMGKRRPGSERLSRGESTKEEVLGQIFTSGKWDKGKMVRSFARLGVTDGGGEGTVVDEKEGKTHVYTLKPLSDKRWEGLKHDLSKNANNSDHHLEKTLEAIDNNASAAGVSRSEANSMDDITTAGLKAVSGSGSGVEKGVILDAGREIRVKLYMGQVFMGWLWFIPTFHMPQPPPTSSTSTSTAEEMEALKSTLVLTRKEVDFPLGLGSAIIDVEVSMEWIVPPPAPVPAGKTTPADGEIVEPPVRARTEDSKIGLDPEPETGIAAAVQGDVSVRELVEAKQAAED